MRRPFFLCVLAVACSRAKAPNMETAHTDSAGWRYVQVQGSRVSFRYPTSHVRSVIDRSSADCGSSESIYGEEPDSAVDGAIVVSSAPANFDSVAHRFGFERPNIAPALRCDESGKCGAVGPWQPARGDQWFAAAVADSIHVGAWRGLIGTMTILGYFNDIPDSLRSPDDDPDATFPKESLYQTRFFALAPVSQECAVVISWRGEPVSEYHGGIEAASWDTALIRHMFSGARVGSSAGQRRTF